MPISLALFAVSIFASAWLIFVVQPLVGKAILPWFGGVPGVWSACLAFYQVTLFLGYAYAHWLDRTLVPARQLLVHAVLFGAALLVLPIVPGPEWKPEGGAEVGHIFAMLAANLALPFLFLAATGPLVQSWFFRRFPSRSPYPLYALSNVGSLAALASYPFLIEPRVALSFQGEAWSWGFGACGLGVLGCALVASRSPAPMSEAAGPAPLASAPNGPLRALLWLGLSMSAVVLLMGVTNRLVTDLASVPFLWILPLAIYLLTFILCFSSERVYHRAVFLPLAAVCLPLLRPEPWLYLAPGVGTLYLRNYFVWPATLFAICMVVHGELYRLRPGAERLTRYYLCVSGGGALGGLFVGLLAPHIFRDYHELPIAVFSCWLLVLTSFWVEPAGRLARGRPRLAWAALGALTLLGTGLLGDAVRSKQPNVLLEERNFFGVRQVFETNKNDPRRYRHVLLSGITNHGIQFRVPGGKQRPTAYYGVATGASAAMRARPHGELRRVGLIGLGTGTLAVYGRPGDLFRFYEIDPDVAAIAQNPALFSFLSDSRADVEVVVGDGRLSLETEVRRGEPPLDMLVLDAFTSASIPIHLLTREAFALYALRLAEDGVITINITNSDVDLLPLVLAQASVLSMSSIQVETSSLPALLSGRSRWVSLSRRTERIDAIASLLAREAGSLGLAPGDRLVTRHDPTEIPQTRLWTDDFSDLLGVLAR